MSDLSAPRGDPSVLRRLNLRAVLRVLHAGGHHTITELARASQLSRPTTAQAVDDLAHAGWISAIDTSVTTGRKIGRPAQAFEFCPDAGHVLGVDIGAHKALALVCNLDGSERSRARIELDPEWPAERRLGALDEVISKAILGLRDESSPITDAVVATPGNVNAAGDVTYCEVIPGWVGVNLGRHVSERFGFPAVTDSDIRMAALAEHWRGVAQDANDIVYLHVGRRPGAALLLDGRPHRGKDGAATQLGATHSADWNGAYRRLVDRTVAAGMSEGDAVVNVLTLAAAGDPESVHRVATFSADLIHGVLPVIIALDPEMVVVGGGMSVAGDALINPIRSEVERSSDFPQVVLGSALGDEGVVLGAVRSALNEAEDRLFANLAPADADKDDFAAHDS